MSRIVTLTTDWGIKDAYVAIFKAMIWQSNPQVNIVDITHQIVPFNLSMAAFQVRQSIPFFPDNTIHIVGVEHISENQNVQYNRWLRSKDAEKDFYFTDYVAFRIYNQYFMCQNNGLIRLLVQDDDIEEIVLLENAYDKSLRHGAFSALDYYASAAARLACEGVKLQDIGKPYEMSFVQTVLNTQAIATPDNNTIIAQVKHIDTYGNVITNLHKSYFEKIAQGRRKFKFSFANSDEVVISQISKGYQKMVSRIGQTNSNIFFVFGVSGYLEIGYRNSNLAQHYGLENADIMSGNFSFTFLDD